MKAVKLKQGETRKDYLIRVAIEMLVENGYVIEPIFYDEAECDAFCLADELRIEFDIEND